LRSRRYHPPADATRITGVDNREAIDIDSFDVFDERYCRIQMLGTSEPVAWHVGDHGPEPTAWVRRVGASRVAVDLLRHDERSYASPGQHALLTRLATWASASPATEVLS
jgi:type 1 glutamine amidotransferase